MAARREVGILEFFNEQARTGMIRPPKGQHLLPFNQSEFIRARITTPRKGMFLSYATKGRGPNSQAVDVLNTTTSFKFDDAYLQHGYFENNLHPT